MTITDQIKHFIGDIARPYCLIAVGTATARVIWAGQNEGAIYAAGGVLAVLYGAKAAEVAFVNRNRPATDQPPA